MFGNRRVSFSLSEARSQAELRASEAAPPQKGPVSAAAAALVDPRPLFGPNAFPLDLSFVSFFIAQSISLQYY